MQRVLTREEIINCEDDILNIMNVSGILHCDSETLRLQAQNKPEMLGFPVIVMGNRVKIPRVPFIRFMGWE